MPYKLETEGKAQDLLKYCFVQACADNGIKVSAFKIPLILFKFVKLAKEAGILTELKD